MTTHYRIKTLSEAAARVSKLSGLPVKSVMLWWLEEGFIRIGKPNPDGSESDADRFCLSDRERDWLAAQCIPDLSSRLAKEDKVQRETGGVKQ